MKAIGAGFLIGWIIAATGAVYYHTVQISELRYQMERANKVVEDNFFYLRLMEQVLQRHQEILEAQGK